MATQVKVISKTIEMRPGYEDLDAVVRFAACITESINAGWNLSGNLVTCTAGTGWVVYTQMFVRGD